MTAERFSLALHRYCAEEGTYTVRGRLPGKVKLAELARRFDERGLSTVYVPRLRTVTVIFTRETVHIKPNGALTVTGAKNLKKAVSALEKLFPGQ